MELEAVKITKRILKQIRIRHDLNKRTFENATVVGWVHRSIFGEDNTHDYLLVQHADGYLLHPFSAFQLNEIKEEFNLPEIVQIFYS